MNHARAAGARGVVSMGLAGLAVLLLWLLCGDLGVSMRERAAMPTALELLRRPRRLRQRSEW
jgi:maltose/moltooligosaccharide transporter